MLDRDAIEEFQRLYHDQYGKWVSDAEAADYGARLIRLIRAVYGDNQLRILFDKKRRRANN